MNEIIETKITFGILLSLGALVLFLYHLNVVINI